MTLYYLLSRDHPAVGQHMYRNWLETLAEAARSTPCRAWLSLPTRFARLIAMTTTDTQASRLDMTRICGELDTLSRALRGPAYVTSAELFTEELLVRAIPADQRYRWSSEKMEASAEIRAGFNVILKASEQGGSVELTIAWLQTGDRHFENLRKYLGKAGQKAASILSKEGWSILNSSTSTAGFHLNARLPLSLLKSPQELSSTSRAMSLALEELRLQ